MSQIIEEKSALYPIADAMGCTLFKSKNTHNWIGSATRTITVGPWVMSTLSSAWSDEISAEASSFFLKLRKHLWGYICWSRDNGLRMVLFSSKDVPIKTDSAPKYGLKDHKKQLAELAPAVKAWFVHDHKNGWQQVTEAEF